MKAISIDKQIAEAHGYSALQLGDGSQVSIRKTDLTALDSMKVPA